MLDVLYEDNHLLAVNKPCGLPTMGVRAGTPSLVSMAKEYLKQQYKKPGNVYLGVVSRLDAWSSGVVVFARTSKAAARLSKQFQERKVRKTYWAIVERPVAPPAGRWTDFMIKDDAAHRMVISQIRTAQDSEAVLRYRTLRACGRGVLVEIGLETGRKHQIRVQFSSRGYPVLGDRKYGSRASFAAESIALHASKIELMHPVRGEPLVIVAPLSAAWRNLGIGD